VSIDAMIQKEAENDSGQVPIVLVTSVALESALTEAVEQIEALQDIVKPVVRFRVEALEP
jgi:homoserine dehydrogenase